MGIFSIGMAPVCLLVARSEPPPPRRVGAPVVRAPSADPPGSVARKDTP
jgi:hypothetical protein